MFATRTVVICTALMLVAPHASGAGTTVDLDVAKTRARAIAFGTVTPPHPSERVRIRLLRDTGEGFVRVGTKFEVLPRSGRFEVSFARPTSGTCRFVVVYLGGRRPSADEYFPCAIPEFGTGSATMTSGADLVTIDLLFAETDEQRAYGLMYRRFLADDKGMAFLWEQDTSGSFFMGNTLIPLSIAFFDGAGRILRIMDMEPCEDGTPCTLYDPKVSYRGALEVNQGAFSTWGVSEGDVIQYTRD